MDSLFDWQFEGSIDGTPIACHTRCSYSSVTVVVVYMLEMLSDASLCNDGIKIVAAVYSGTSEIAVSSRNP